MRLLQLPHNLKLNFQKYRLARLKISMTLILGILSLFLMSTSHADIGVKTRIY